MCVASLNHHPFLLCRGMGASSLGVFPQHIQASTDPLTPTALTPFCCFGFPGLIAAAIFSLFLFFFFIEKIYTQQFHPCYKPLKNTNLLTWRCFLAWVVVRGIEGHSKCFWLANLTPCGTPLIFRISVRWIWRRYISGASFSKVTYVAVFFLFLNSSQLFLFLWE